MTEVGGTRCYVCGGDTAPVSERDGVTYSACADGCCLQCPLQSVRYPDETDRELWQGGRNSSSAFEARWHTLLGVAGVPEKRWVQTYALLDYGCGLRQWVDWLRERNCLAVGYDPWTAGEAHPAVGVYGAVTMIEIVEHLGPDLAGAFEWIAREKLMPGGWLYVQTQLWRGEDMHAWWYVRPKAGHISIVSLAGLERLGAMLGLRRLALGSDHTIWQKEGE
jgi:hypothetical protein